MKAALIRAMRNEDVSIDAIVRIMGEVFGEQKPIDLAVFGVQQCGSVTFQAERLTAIQPALHELHAAHYAETEGYRNGERPMIPDYEHMADSDLSGRMVQFTARQDGRLVGHGRWYIHRSTHTMTPYAGEDALFLLPECRRGRVGMKFLDFQLDGLRTIGIHEFRGTSKVGHPAGARLFSHAGFTHAAEQWILIDEEKSNVL